MTLQLTRRTLNILGQNITFELPASQDQLLEFAIASETSGSSDSDPYWGSLWETSPRTAAIILQHQWPTRLKALELGCGIGVTGIAALIAGHDVTFSDHATAAVRLAVHNAGLNGFPNATGKVFDKQWDVVDVFAERWKMQPYRIQPEIQIFTESSPTNIVFQITVCGGNNPYVNSENFCRTKPIEFSGF